MVLEMMTPEQEQALQEHVHYPPLSLNRAATGGTRLVSLNGKLAQGREFSNSL